MEEIKILICGNYKKEEINKTIRKLNSDLLLDIIIKDCSNNTHNQNIEYYISLINNIEYFNAFILNFSKKNDIFEFFKSFNSEEYGITNECYPFFLINKNTLSKLETNKFINDLNQSKENEYKFKLGNILFYNELEGIEKKDFQSIILNIYNCYRQDSKKYIEENNSKETINILLIGLKNAGKSYLINKLLGETRALSMENHYTTKMNTYKHSNYPIVFYDTCGFNENEDDEIRNFNSKIDEFINEYNNIKNKIHAIFYVIDCNSVRIFQNKEKKLIENILNINIPLFIVGQKAKLTNKSNFIRKTKLELSSLSIEYRDKINILINRIYCLDSSIESYNNFLDQVYLEFMKSKLFNDEIINAINDNEDLINNSFSENPFIGNERQDILKIYNYIKKSIFFNNYNEIIKEVYNNIYTIRDKYINDNYYFKNLDIESLNYEIENEFQKIFKKNDLEKIYKLLKEQQNDLNNKEKNISELKSYYGSSAIILCITFLLAYISSSYFLIIIPVLCIVNFVLLNKRNNNIISLINENIGHFLNKFEWKYIKLNLKDINEKAEIYNEALIGFNKFIENFKKNDLID